MFRKFVEDIMPDTKLLSLPMELYGDIVNVIQVPMPQADDQTILMKIWQNVRLKDPKGQFWFFVPK